MTRAEILEAQREYRRQRSAKAIQRVETAFEEYRVARKALDDWVADWRARRTGEAAE